MIKKNLQKVLSELPQHVKLVAVSKTKPNEDIMEAYHAGHKIFGENKAQELIQKQPELPGDIEWHFIGHLQRNKVKYMAPYVKMIHSVDSLRLLKEINKQALKNDRVIDCLMQFHIAKESTKFGLSMEEAKDIIAPGEYNALNNIKICGVMGMATFTSDMKMIREEFKTLKNIFDQLKTSHFKDVEHFKEISMGMTNDYQIAIEEGSTIVRIGSEIFGARSCQVK